MQPFDPLKKYQSALSSVTGQNITIHKLVPVGGGNINQCLKAETNIGFFFIKENDAEKFPGMFETEIKGLQLLSRSGSFIIPEVLHFSPEKNRSSLFLEWLEKKSPGPRDWYHAGEKLAALHQNTNPAFGLDHDNYIGSLRQSNTKHDSWGSFFTLERILPQVKLARDNGRIDSMIVSRAEKFCAKTGTIFPEEKPALLHGDLWNGNFMFSEKGPAVFDPAVYYGHREMDIAMTKLFGGFDPDFYAGYSNVFGLEPDWEKRIAYCNLYPLLVHVNLFGESYLYDVKNILAAF